MKPGLLPQMLLRRNYAVVAFLIPRFPVSKTVARVGASSTAVADVGPTSKSVAAVGPTSLAIEVPS